MVQIAKLAGVSQPTVSDILNDRWRAKRISARLATRVRKLALKHHYRPNRLIRALQTGRTHTLALVVPTLSGHYFSRIASAIEAEAKRHGYHLLISQVVRGLEDEIEEIEVLLERRVDGLILVPRYGQHNRVYYRRLVRQGIPLVFVDEYFPDVPCPSVVGADEAGMHAITCHLIALRHRRVAYLDWEVQENTHLEDRFRGFRRAMSDHGLAAPGERLRISGQEAVAAMLHQPVRPTAIIANSDYYALDAIRTAMGIGLRVPDDVAVVGFSDCLENVDFLRVPLTSVRVDLEAMGGLAMQRFLREVDRVSRRHEVTRVPATVVVRESCGGAARPNGPGSSRGTR